MCNKPIQLPVTTSGSPFTLWEPDRFQETIEVQGLVQGGCLWGAAPADEYNDVYTYIHSDDDDDDNDDYHFNF